MSHIGHSALQAETLMPLVPSHLRGPAIVAMQLSVRLSDSRYGARNTTFAEWSGYLGKGDLIELVRGGSMRTFEIPKGTSGDTREIQDPGPARRKAQAWLLRCLAGLDEAHKPVIEINFGGQPGRGPQDLGRRLTKLRGSAPLNQVLSLDATKLFPSITERTVRKEFRKLGFSGFDLHVATKAACYKGSLSTGGVSSPMIAALVTERALKRVRRALSSRGWRIACYIDDVVLWSQRENADASEAQRLVAVALGQVGVRLNKDKTVLTRVSQHNAPLLGGVVSLSSEGKVTVRASRRHKRRQRLSEHVQARDSLRKGILWMNTGGRSGWHSGLADDEAFVGIQSYVKEWEAAKRYRRTHYDTYGMHASSKTPWSEQRAAYIRLLEHSQH